MQVLRISKITRLNVTFRRSVCTWMGKNKREFFILNKVVTGHYRDGVNSI